ncbi:hypothetical protein JZ751_013890 [Albula glossodonta]|uniref:Ig-like domain-containing protein n=1 Tax=Albula glossodonta TaxID=121402 RepID=A0A8T2MYL3_9TELE|nr:hypothetical protein JZ751_013890 [Albula glossodonta]
MHVHTHCTHMDNLLLLFFLTSLPAVLSVQTESRVTAQRGGSVSIPCRYDQKYRDSVKYWCRGVLWGTCAVLVRTDSPQRRGDVSITDDPAQLVFTVTMGNLQVRDTNKYWCAVKIKGYGTPDDKAGVFLSVTSGTPPPPPSALSTLSGLTQPSASLATPQAVLSVQTESRVTAQRGGSVSIPCRYDQKYRDSVKYWCRGVLNSFAPDNPTNANLQVHTNRRLWGLQADSDNICFSSTNSAVNCPNSTLPSADYTLYIFNSRSSCCFVIHPADYAIARCSVNNSYSTLTVSPRRPKVAVPTSHSVLPATSSASVTGPKGDTTLESLGPKRYSDLCFLHHQQCGPSALSDRD